MKTIVFVGAGSIVESMIKGMVGSDIIDAKNIFVMNKSDRERLISLQAKYGVSIVCSNYLALKNADLVILAVKPKDTENMMANLYPLLEEKTAILSVIAGVSFEKIEKGLGSRPIASSVLNTSSAIGKSSSGVAWNELITPEVKDLILKLFQAIGIVKEVDEDTLHTITAMSGSGPAYIYYLVEALEEASSKQGLSKDISRDLIIQTLIGAATMLKVTGSEPVELRRKVTSPGGTTAAGLKALEEMHFKEAIADCVNKAEKRSREIG